MKCEEVRMWAMALADGEEPPAPAARIQEHLAACSACRAEVEALESLSGALGRQRRRPLGANVWPAVAARLEPSSNRALWLPPLALLLFKLIEFVPDRAPAWWVQLIPLAAAVVTFAWIRVNPFQINAGLGAGEESKS